MTADSDIPSIDAGTARRYVAGQLALVLVTLTHALLTWSLAETAALFVGGVAVAFAVEVPAVRAGLFTHSLRPQIGGVPVSILLTWPAVVYLAVQVASLVVEGPLAVAGAAATLATLADAVIEPRAVAAGAWAYTDALPGPRVRGVPWWNAAGWFVVVFVTALLPAVV